MTRSAAGVTHQEGSPPEVRYAPASSRGRDSERRYDGCISRASGPMPDRKGNLMKTTFVVCLALAVPVVACASDPNKKAVEAQKEETEKAEKNAEKTAEQTKKSEEQS